MAAPTMNQHTAMGQMHRDRRYRSMQLRRDIKPVMRLSNMNAARTAEELAWFRAQGFHAEPCHTGYNFDENDLYRFSDDGGELFYIFVSPQRSRIDEMLAYDREEKMSGADRAAATRGIGRLLGYPPCCTDYHLSFSGVPHQSSFLLRPLHTTRGSISPTIHPTMRLLGHFFCALDCPQTEATHQRILTALDEELPEHAAFVRPQLRRPLLHVEWDLAFTFEGTAEGDIVEYRSVLSHGLPSARHPAAEALRALIEGGDRCSITDTVITVWKGAQLLGSFDTRPLGLPPVWFPMDGAPIGKRHHRIAVLRPVGLAEGSVLDRSLRLTAGDLAHRGYAAELVAAATAETAASMGFTVAVAAPEHAHLAGPLPVVRAGDRHATILAVDAVSVGQPCPPVPARGATDAHRRMWWPSPFLRSHRSLDSLRHLRDICLAADPDPCAPSSDPDELVAFLRRQVRRHATLDGGERAVLPGAAAAHLPALLDEAAGQIAVRIAGQQSMLVSVMRKHISSVFFLLSSHVLC